MEEFITIYAPYIVVNGIRIEASDYGRKAFRIYIPKDPRRNR